MAFQHFILIATVFLSNRVTGLACPFHIKNESPYVTEESFFGIWYPQYVITNYDPSTEDIERFACAIFNAEKSKNNHYQLKLKRFDPRFKNDKKLQMFDDFLPVNPNKFGTFWFDDQKIGGIDMYTGYMRVLDIFSRGDYMVILSCTTVKNHNISMNGFVLRRESHMYYKNSAVQYYYAKMAIHKSLKKYLISLSDVQYEFQLIRLSQSDEICEQFNSTISGARNFLFQSNFYFISIILFVIQRF